VDTILLKIERSRDLAPKALKGMLKHELVSMIRAVEKVMNGMSDEIAKERKEGYREEQEKKERGRIMNSRKGKEARDKETKMKTLRKG
jgi:hypothetical protein